MSFGPGSIPALLQKAGDAASVELAGRLEAAVSGLLSRPQTVSPIEFVKLMREGQRRIADVGTTGQPPQVDLHEPVP